MLNSKRKRLLGVNTLFHIVLYSLFIIIDIKRVLKWGKEGK